MDWHRRYLQQARWTRELRAYLFRQAGLQRGSRVLEVGCGTGAVLSELPAEAELYGLDLDSAALAHCRLHAPGSSLVQGDAIRLPWAGKTFDIIYCHFLLLWVKDPLGALLEMKRAAKAGAHILAFAEPDYIARVDRPPELVRLGRWQAESLRRQGADPGLGARLADLFFQAGIPLVETAPLKSAGDVSSPEEWEAEWAVIESDLEGLIPRDEVEKMKRLDQQARARGERELHVPTYFAWGHT